MITLICYFVLKFFYTRAGSCQGKSCVVSLGCVDYKAYLYRLSTFWKIICVSPPILIENLDFLSTNETRRLSKHILESFLGIPKGITWAVMKAETSIFNETAY